MIINLCWGFFAPLHTAHLDLFEGAKLFQLYPESTKVIVLINDDEQLKNKKNGLVVMEEWDRARLVSQIKSVDHAFIVHGLEHAKDTVKTSIDYYNPTEVNMCMGGDRSEKSKIDKDLIKFCEDLNIQIRYGIGGVNKERSSTNIVNNIINWVKANELS